MNEKPVITLKKWGNSIGLLLPAAMAKAAHLSSGNRVEIDVSDGTLTVRKAPGQSRIEELCSAITPENLHSEAGWGSPQGNEAW
ncbi:AbrB/MazE/SpoVT family DNA-binding domain-containing protein [Luteolibacter sp. Populi]|uniref:AbrB/MazE/SpoVT family DNA-binding domain-containing protein n=1 Tax=Luteolibacter sp. Populi TaxID=3230487 RepID=UPI0034653267